MLSKMTLRRHLYIPGSSNYDGGNAMRPGGLQVCVKCTDASSGEAYLLAAVGEHPPDPDSPVRAAGRKVPPVPAESQDPYDPGMRRQFLRSDRG